jgi:hypothetical protein
MPSEMFERGRRDAEADALDENYYQYYYDYKLAYDEVVRKRRRTRRGLLLSRVRRGLLRALPVLLLVGGIGFGAYQYLGPGKDLASASAPTATPTPRPTLVPPTPRPPETPTPELALRVDGFAVVTGTQGAALRARQAPGTNKDDIVARFQEGQTVKLLEGPQEATGMTWWRIELDGKSGWASAAYLQPVAPPP